jgi:hypothetical protein
MTKYPPPYPRKDFSFDDPIPSRENETKHIPSQGCIDVDGPVFAVINGKALGQKQLRQLRHYVGTKKRVRLGSKTLVDVRPHTKGDPRVNQNIARSSAQNTLRPDSMPAIANECVRDLFAIILKEQKDKRQTAKLPMVAEPFPNASGNLEERWQACKQYLDILNDLKKAEIEGKVNAVIRTLQESAAARKVLVDVMTVEDNIRYQRQKDTESDQRRVEQSYEDEHRKRLGKKYEPKHRKRYLGEIVDLQNLPPVTEDFVGAAGTLLGIGASSLAHAYGIDMSPLQSVYRAFRRKRAKPRMTTPKQPKPQPPLPHEREYQEFVRRNAERRKQREVRAAQGTMTNGA